MFSQISFLLVLLLVITCFSIPNSAEARSADEPCSYLHPQKYYRDPNTGLCHQVKSSSSISAPVQNYATNSPANTFQQISCGEGTILKNNSCVIDFRHEVTAQGQTDGINDAFLPVTNLFDNIPDNQWLTHEWDAFSAKVDPVLIGFFGAIFIASIFIGRQFSRKKRITRRNRRRWGNFNPLTNLQILSGFRNANGILTQHNPRVLRVSPSEHRIIQEFERGFNTVGKSDPEYFLHVVSGAKLIDASKRGNELYGIDTMIHGRTLKILQYRDPSTNQLYISFVPQKINKADDGMAWKFKLTRDEYDGLVSEA